MSFDEIRTALLAEGGWSELIGVIVLVGIYAIGAIAKVVSNRSEESKEDAQSKQRAVELAKKYAQDRHAQRTAPKRHPDTLSEWDRKQELKRRRQELQAVKQPSEPVSVPVFRESEMPFQQPKMVSPTPELMPSAESPKPAIFHQFMEAIQQRQQAARQTQPIPKPKPVTAGKPAKALKQRTVAETAPAVRPLDQYLRNVGDLRAAIILKEILDKPIAMREDW